MACPDYKALVRSFGEGPLPPAQERLLRDHLADCASCRKTVRLLGMEDAALAAALLGGARRPPPGPFPRRLLRAILAALLLLLVLLAILLVVYRRIEIRGSTGEAVDSGRIGRYRFRQVLTTRRFGGRGCPQRA